ncbi:Glycoside-hydrolase family GH114 TIM-barrel domain-containing protein [Plasmodiophora brassicae]
MGIKGVLAFVAAVLYGAALIDATWTPPQIGMGWQWVLSFNKIPNVATPNVPVWDIDPEQLTSASDIATLMSALKAHNRYVICYVNVGSLDTGANDAGSFPKSIIGNAYPDWPGEYFLDIRSSVTRSLIKARFQRMASYGCDGIEPDNLDTYTEKTFAPAKPDLTLTDALDYMTWISTTVHDLGMAIGLKNGGDLVEAHNLASVFDFAIVESCAEFSGDCAEYAPFIQAGKPVFAAEYTTAGSGGCPVIKSATSSCAATNAQDFEGIVKTCDLGTEWKGCQTYDSNGYRTSAHAQISPSPTPLRQPPSKTSSWGRRVATTNGEHVRVQSGGSPVSGALAGPTVQIVGAAVGLVLGVVGTVLAMQVWIRRRDARAKPPSFYTVQLPAV